MVKLNEQGQAIVELQVMPGLPPAMPSITGSAMSKQAGTHLPGHFPMDYQLPGGDTLRLIANHNKSVVQIFLLTHDPEKLRNMPGKRPASLVANTIASLNRYLIRSDSYNEARSEEQQAKYDATRKAAQALSAVLGEERNLSSTDWADQERLRSKVIAIVEKCRDKNRLIANNPVISEGALGDLLYDLKQEIQHYEFNRVYPVSKLDQLDFSEVAAKRSEQQPCFVWDSDIHIGGDELALKDCLRVICQTYGLDPGKALTNVVANRFERLGRFFHQLWQDAIAWGKYLTQPKKPEQSHRVEKLAKDITGIDVTPYYSFSGSSQDKHDSLQDMVASRAQQSVTGYEADDVEQAKAMLSHAAHGRWVKIRDKNQLIARLNDELISLRYAENNGQFFLLPNGDDLEKLSQISKKPLFLFEKIHLGLRALFTRIPAFFKNFYLNLRHAITVELPGDWNRHIHGNHHVPKPMMPNRPSETEQSKAQISLDSLHDVLVGQGLMSSGQTLEDFVRHHLSESQYVIAREQHPPGPVAYSNPLHRTLDVTRHFAAFFVDTSEKNPIIGTLAMAAYFYGAGAVITPKLLMAVLTKLHMNGLIAGIVPTQDLGKWMSNGMMSEAIASAMTYWQGVITVGYLDDFFIQAVTILRDDPVEVAAAVVLAISLGYGLCQAIPVLQEEMGRFPWINYAFLGAKTLSLPYDTLAHPGDDWLLGTLKWIMRFGLVVAKVLAGPLIEGYRYGYEDGFLPGLRKSGNLLVKSLKQTLAAVTDLALSIATIPFLEFSGMMIHVPFRGVTNAISRTLGALGHWQPLGRILLAFSNRSSRMNYMSSYHRSQLYGFTSPFQTWVEDNRLLNGLANAAMLPILPTFQLVKNFLILPLAEITSISLRLTAFIVDPLSRFIAYAAGNALVASGYIWDNTVGILLRTAAEGVTLSSNWLDSKADAAKQASLEKIQVARRAAQHWAFAEEDKASHQVNQDDDYFLDKPVRLEQLPHRHGDSTSCLLSALLHQKIDGRRGLENDEETSDDDTHGYNWLKPPPAGNNQRIETVNSSPNSSF